MSGALAVQQRCCQEIVQIAAPAVMTAPTSAVRPLIVAGLVGVERLLHLHRLQDDDQVALGDGVTLGDRDLDDGALHRARSASRRDAAAPALDRRPARARLRPAVAAAVPPPTPQPGRERDLQALAADLDHHGLARSPASAASPRVRLNGAIGVVELGLDPAGVDA